MVRDNSGSTREKASVLSDRRIKASLPFTLSWERHPKLGKGPKDSSQVPGEGQGRQAQRPTGPGQLWPGK